MTLKSFSRQACPERGRRNAKSARRFRNPPFIPLCQRGKEGDLINVGVSFDVAQDMLFGTYLFLAVAINQQSKFQISLVNSIRNVGGF
jgi:hypothetical protein